MRRINSDQAREKGAAAVVVALFMTMLLVAAAVVIDVGLIFSEKAQLQNGADAAALAVAQSCAKNDLYCASGSSLAQPIVNANALDGVSGVDDINFDSAGRTVVVKTSNEASDGRDHLTLIFASALGVGTVQFDASAEAAWGNLGTGPASLGLAFAQCEFKPHATKPQALYSHGKSAGNCVGVKNSAGSDLPGGFGWLVSTGDCRPTVAVEDNIALSATGASIADACVSALAQQKGRVVWLPVYGWASGAGANGAYKIVSWAGFELLAYKFPNARWPEKNSDNPLTDWGIYGNFIEFRDMPPGFDLGPTSPYGTTVFSLTK